MKKLMILVFALINILPSWSQLPKYYVEQNGQAIYDGLLISELIEMFGDPTDVNIEEQNIVRDNMVYYYFQGFYVLSVQPFDMNPENFLADKIFIQSQSIHTSWSVSIGDSVSQIYEVFEGTTGISINYSDRYNMVAVFDTSDRDITRTITFRIDEDNEIVLISFDNGLFLF